MFSSLPGASAPEFRPGLQPRAGITHVIFDFDGTLSWLRHGWPEIMCGLFQEYYPARPEETPAAIHDLLLEELLSLNGKPSIYQMERFAERVRERGAAAPEPQALLTEYSRRLDARISERTARVANGTAAPDEYVVHGARAMVEQLAGMGLRLVILSGTIEHRVREEAALLGLTSYFEPHIYGSTADHTQFSKRGVMDRLLREEGIAGTSVLSFGDGPVEIEQTKDLGGMAIAVASNEEHNGSGIMDEAKRRQLIAAGADSVIADYRNPETFLPRVLVQA